MSGRELDSRKTGALSAMVCSRSVEEAAELAGVSATTTPCLFGLRAKNYGHLVLFPLTLPVRWAKYAPALGGGMTISGQVSILESGRFRSPRTFAFDLLKSSKT